MIPTKKDFKPFLTKACIKNKQVGFRFFSEVHAIQLAFLFFVVVLLLHHKKDFTFFIALDKLQSFIKFFPSRAFSFLLHILSNNVLFPCLVFGFISLLCILLLSGGVVLITNILHIINDLNISMLLSLCLYHFISITMLDGTGLKAFFKSREEKEQGIKLAELMESLHQIKENCLKKKKQLLLLDDEETRKLAEAVDKLHDELKRYPEDDCDQIAREDYMRVTVIVFSRKNDTRKRNDPGRLADEREEYVRAKADAKAIEKRRTRKEWLQLDFKFSTSLLEEKRRYYTSGTLGVLLQKKWLLLTWRMLAFFKYCKMVFDAWICRTYSPRYNLDDVEEYQKDLERVEKNYLVTIGFYLIGGHILHLILFKLLAAAF